MSKPPEKGPTITFGDGTVLYPRSVEIDYGPRDSYRSLKPLLEISFECHFDADLVPVEMQELMIQTNPHLGWIFPDDPFVIYEPKDEQWCRALGFGKEGLVYDSVHVPKAVITLKNDNTIEVIPVGEVHYIQGGLSC